MFQILVFKPKYYIIIYIILVCFYHSICYFAQLETEYHANVQLINVTNDKSNVTCFYDVTEVFREEKLSTDI